MEGQIRIEAFLRDGSLRAAEECLGGFGIIDYALIQAKVHSGVMSPSPEIRRDPDLAYLHKRHKLEVTVNQGIADEVRSRLQEIVQSDPIALTSVLVTAYSVYPVEAPEHAISG